MTTLLDMLTVTKEDYRLIMWKDYILLGVTLQHYDEIDPNEENKSVIRTMCHVFLRSKNQLWQYTAKPDKTSVTRRAHRLPTQFHFVPKSDGQLVHFFCQETWDDEFCNNCRHGACGSSTCLSTSDIAGQESIFAFQEATEPLAQGWHCTEGVMYADVKPIVTLDSQFCDAPRLWIDTTLLMSTSHLTRHCPIYIFSNDNNDTLSIQTSDWLKLIVNTNPNCKQEQEKKQTYRYFVDEQTTHNGVFKRIPVIISCLNSPTFKLRLFVFGPSGSGKSFIAMHLPTSFRVVETQQHTLSLCVNDVEKLVLDNDVIIIDPRHTLLFKKGLRALQYNIVIIDLSISSLLVDILPAELHFLVDEYGL